MPSRHRLRHSSSTSNASLFLNPKCATATATITTTTSATTKLNKSSSLSSFNNNNSGSCGVGFQSNNYYKFNDGGGLTEKQQRNAYLATLTKEQLKTECRKRGQKTSGNRTELLQRLGVKMSQLQKQEHQEGGVAHNQRKAKDLNNSVNIKSLSSFNKSNSNVSSGLTTKTTINGSTNLSPGNGGKSVSFPRKQSIKDKEKEKEERQKIVLWRKPFLTVKYCSLECAALTNIYGKRIIQHRTSLVAFILLLTILGGLYKIPGRHQLYIDIIRSNTWFIVYWVGLGVLSSVGLGTGLHTFILYLGPHIASVTLAAYECNALNFPKPPYPDDIICPEVPDTNVPPNLWNIMAKVRFEAFLWGVGTALGELPPYFMAKAARLSGYDPDDAEDLQAFEELQKKQETGDLNILDRAKLFMERVVEKVGFLGILACASIPNPLFDLAGITCGHFLVPFWTFFGATVLGKAVIKMHIQKIFVIIAFNESLIERAVDLLSLIPIFGHRLQEPFKGFLNNQKKRLHRTSQSSSTTKINESGNLISKIFEYFVIAMVCYFIISIINSLAQSYHKRIHKKHGKVNYKKLSKD